MLSRRILLQAAILGTFDALFLQRTNLAAENSNTVEFTQSRIAVEVPDVVLRDHEARSIPLAALMAKSPLVVLDFFFASCSTVCPVLSAAFVHLQDNLPPNSGVQLISIAIDPEHDTPEVLRSYRERHHAKNGWTLLTGKKEDIVRVMKAFDAYVENKMSHKPLNFLHAQGQADWLRLEGAVSGSALLDAVKSLQSPAKG